VFFVDTLLGTLFRQQCLRVGLTQTNIALYTAQL